jgi:hypothetical protein
MSIAWESPDLCRRIIGRGGKHPQQPRHALTQINAQPSRLMCYGNNA